MKELILKECSRINVFFENHLLSFKLGDKITTDKHGKKGIQKKTFIIKKFDSEKSEFNIFVSFICIKSGYF
jgi:hypothetical protein